MVVVGEAGRDGGREEGWIGKGREIGDGESSLGREKVSSRLPPRERPSWSREGWCGESRKRTKGVAHERDYYLDYYST